MDLHDLYECCLPIDFINSKHLQNCDCMKSRRSHMTIFISNFQVELSFMYKHKFGKQFPI